MSITKGLVQENKNKSPYHGVLAAIKALLLTPTRQTEAHGAARGVKTQAGLKTVHIANPFHTCD